MNIANDVNSFNIINEFIQIIQNDIDNYNHLFNIKPKHDLLIDDKKHDKVIDDKKQDKVIEGEKHDDVIDDEVIDDKIIDRNRIILDYDSCENNYILVLEDNQSFISIPPVDDFLYKISPSYKFLNTTSGNNNKKCICYATLLLPTTLNNKSNTINNNYYSNNELEDLNNKSLDVKCDNIINFTDMLLYTGIINDNWYIPINNIYSIGEGVKQNIYNNNVIISDYCISLFQRNKLDISLFDFKLKYNDGKITIDVNYTEKNKKDLEYLVYTTFMGKEKADIKFNLSYTKNHSINNYIINNIDKYDKLKIVDNDIKYIKKIINNGNLENVISNNIKKIHETLHKRSFVLKETLNNFRLGNRVGYYYLHLICGYSLYYLLKDKIELLKEKKMYSYNFDNEYNIIKKYGETFNYKLQKEFTVNMIGGKKKKKNQKNMEFNKEQNKEQDKEQDKEQIMHKPDDKIFTHYRHNIDAGYIDFVTDYINIVNNNKTIIQSILNKNIN